MRGGASGGGPVLMSPPPVSLLSLTAVVNSTGGGGSGLAGLAFRGTMGSNALSFSSGGGPGAIKSYSTRTSATTHRSVRK